MNKEDKQHYIKKLNRSRKLVVFCMIAWLLIGVVKVIVLNVPVFTEVFISMLFFGYTYLIDYAIKKIEDLNDD